MKESKHLEQISLWEKSKPSDATFECVHFRNGFVTKITGSFRGQACIWDGFGLSYHRPSNKRFRAADINFKR